MLHEYFIEFSFFILNMELNMDSINSILLVIDGNNQNDIATILARNELQ